MLERIFHITSIKGKLTAVMMTVAGIVLLLVTLAFVVNEAFTFRRAILQELNILATVVGQNTTAAITFGDKKSAAATLTALSSRRNLLAAYILTPDGEVFAETISPAAPGMRRIFSAGRDQDGMRENLATITNLERDSLRAWEWDQDLEGVEWVVLDDEVIGVVIIQSDLKELFERLKWFFALVLLITAIALGVAFLLSGKMHRPISDPILDLAGIMKKVSADREYGIRAAKTTSDEIGQLIDGFNDMLTQIQMRDEGLERAAADLRESNEEVKNFAYIVSHDMRAPLVSIKGFTGELRIALQNIDGVIEKCLPHLDDQERERFTRAYRDDAAEAMKFIGSSADRMDGLINAVLNLSRLGRRDLHLEPVDLSSVVNKIIRSLAHQIEQKNVRVTIGTLPEVTADRLAVEQIMGNLLDNALKYLEAGRDGEIAVTADRDEAQTTIHIRDNGRGIAADDMHKVFDLFRRAGRQDVPGEGMGLAYVKTLVRRHGGRIWCESELGRGSTFSLTIPRPVNVSGERTGTS